MRSVNMSLDEKLFHRMMRMPRMLREEFLKDLGVPAERGCGRGHHGHHGTCGQQGRPQEGGPCRGQRQDGMHHGHGCHGGPHHRMLARERVLSALLGQDEGVRQKTLAELLGVAPSSISEFIDRLEAGGYIERTVDPADKRATLIGLTEKGRARAYELEDEKKAHFAAVFRRLTEEEKEELLRLLEKLAAPESEEE